MVGNLSGESRSQALGYFMKELSLFEKVPIKILPKMSHIKMERGYFTDFYLSKMLNVNMYGILKPMIPVWFSGGCGERFSRRGNG
jgi:hypothetical protein